METISQLALDFVRSFPSQNTQKSYLKDLENFFQYCQKSLGLFIESPEQITEKLILLWHHELLKYSNATRCRKLSSLSSFLEYLKRKKIISTNEAVLLARPKVSQHKKTSILTRDEILKILDVTKKNAHFELASEKHNSIWYLRYVVLYTLFSVGMRVEELCTLRIDSLELKDGYWKLHMLVKGNEKHSPVIHENTARLLLDYIQNVRKNAAPEDVLFINSRNKSYKDNKQRHNTNAENNKTTKNNVPLHRATVFTIIKACAQEAQIQKNISPHSCRASLATLLHQEKVPISQIQSLLNHKQITTTAIYIQKSEDLKTAAALDLERIFKQDA